MTKEELKRFYATDEHLYNLSENKKFLLMFNHLVDERYDLFIGIKEMQDLIDKIVNWYEIKYPEREFDFYEKKGVYEINGFIELSKFMDFNQLFLRLTDNQQKLLEGLYRSKDEKEFPIYEEGKIIGLDKKVYYKIIRKVDDVFYNKHKDFVISVDAKTGLIDMDYEIEKYTENDETYISDLVKLFDSKYSDRLDFLEIRKANNNKYLDNYLRNKILEFAALKLLYSKRTTPERGYERAKRFICEFNKKLGIDLNADLIDEAMNYKEKKSKVKMITR